MSKSKELLQLVDKEIGVIRQKGTLLEEMSACVREGEATALEELVQKEAEIDAASEELESRMRSICSELASERGLGEGDATLGRVAADIAGPEGIAIQDRHQRLVMAVEDLKDKAAATAALVRKALEINERLLSALIGPEEGETYCPDGELERQRQGVTFQHSV